MKISTRLLAVPLVVVFIASTACFTGCAKSVSKEEFAAAQTKADSARAAIVSQIQGVKDRLSTVESQISGLATKPELAEVKLTADEARYAASVVGGKVAEVTREVAVKIPVAESKISGLTTRVKKVEDTLAVVRRDVIPSMQDSLYMLAWRATITNERVERLSADVSVAYGNMSFLVSRRLSEKEIQEMRSQAKVRQDSLCTARAAALAAVSDSSSASETSTKPPDQTAPAPPLTPSPPSPPDSSPATAGPGAK